MLCAIYYPGMDVITSIATIPTYKPAERIRLFNDFAQLIGDERAQTARAMWDRPLKTVYISDCGELKVTKQSLSPPSLPWAHDCQWHDITHIANFVSLLLGSSLCTLWGVYITSVIKLMHVPWAVYIASVINLYMFPCWQNDCISILSRLFLYISCSL